MMEQSKGFKNILFGKASAENEKSLQYRKLLLQGFLDTYNYTDSLLNSDKFLVLGLKGSGKSAIAARIELLSGEMDNLIVGNYYLSEKFPHRLFSKLMDIQESQIIRFQYYWEYLILILMLESFSKDDSITYENMDVYKALIKAMEKLELIPDKSFTDLVTITKTDRFRTATAHPAASRRGMQGAAAG